MGIGEATYNKYEKEVQDIIKRNPYLTARTQAVKDEAESDKAIREAKKKKAAPPEKVIHPMLHDPENQKTQLFDALPRILRRESFFKMVLSIQDANTAEKFLQSLTYHMKLLIDLETPSRENHGFTKILEPEDYDKLKKSSDSLVEQTSQLFKEFSTENANGIKAKEGFQASLNTLSSFAQSLYKDADMIQEISKNKAPVPLNVALKNVRNIQMTGEFDKGNTLGGNLSSRQIITIEDAEGNHKTGLFTAKRVVTPVNSATNNTAKKFLGAHNEDRLDNRNSAMTRVSELLGRSNLLAYSKEMKIDNAVTPDNPTGTGTFMEAVTGTDIDRLLPEDPYFQIDYKNQNRDIYEDSAKKDMMDLSIIDYLCGNIDRHCGNILYHYNRGTDGKVRMSGMVGIDNDTSFTAENPPVNEPHDRLSALSETLCISETMVQKLEAMTPESLRQDMAQFNFTQKQQTAMTERLLNLKEAIKTGRHFQKTYLKDEAAWNDFLANGMQFVTDKLGSSKDRKPCIVVIPDEKLPMLSVDGLADTKNFIYSNTEYGNGIFHVINEIHNQDYQQSSLRSARYNQKSNMKKLESHTILKEGIADFSEIVNSCADHTQEFLTECRRKTSKLYGTSPQFDHIVSTLQAIEQAAAHMGQEGYIPKNNDANRISALYKRLQENCNEYLTHKDDELKRGKSHSGYAKKRIELVNRIKQYADVTRSRVRNVWNKELSDLNIQLARSDNAINSLIMKMKPLEEYLAANKQNSETANHLGNENPVQADRMSEEKENALKECIPKLCEELYETSKTVPEYPGLGKAVNFCAATLQKVIDHFEKDVNFNLDENTRSMLESCKQVRDAKPAQSNAQTKSGKIIGEEQEPDRPTILMH